MSKTTNPVKNSVRADVSWLGDSAFTPPGNGENTAPRKTYAPTGSRAGDLRSLAEELLDALIGAVKASAGMVRILPAHGQNLQIIGSIGVPAELLEASSAANLDCEACDKVDVGHGIYSADISACKTRQDCRYGDCRLQSLIIAPLDSDSAPGDSIGTITLFFDAPPKPVDQVSMTVAAFAHLFVALIEQSKSNREARRIDLIAERRSIANEIHDSLAQTLVYARMRTNLLIESIRAGNETAAANYASEVDDALESSQKTVRELITNFRCEMDPSGLLHALEALTGQFCERNDIALEYVNRVADLDLPFEYEIQVYHIVHEALANIATHSGATHARLTIGMIGDKYVFTVEDNGRGGCTFKPVEGHYGMMIMRERAARINGEITIESKEGSGTMVRLSFVYPAARVERD